MLDEEDIPFETYYKRLKTYSCRVVKGIARPGYDPEVESGQQHIIETRWLDLRSPAGWDASVRLDRLIFPLLQRIRELLGYAGVSPKTGR